MCARLRFDESGGVLVEATVMLVIIFIFVLGCGGAAGDGPSTTDELVGGQGAGDEFPATVRLMLPGGKCPASGTGANVGLPVRSHNATAGARALISRLACLGEREGSRWLEVSNCTGRKVFRARVDRSPQGPCICSDRARR